MSRVHDRGMERYVLGAALLSPSKVLSQHGGLNPATFHADGHAELWRLLVSMHDEGEQIDLVTVCRRVQSNPDRYGGLSYVAALADNVVADEIGSHIRTLRDLAERRDRIRRCRDAVDRLVAGDPIDEAIADIDPTDEARDGELVGADRLARKTWEKLADRWDRLSRGEDPVLPVPIETMAQQVRLPVGVGRLVIVCGRPAMGKTALAVQWVARVVRSSVAGEHGTRPGSALFFSLEMDSEQLFQRVVSQQTGVPMWVIEQNRMSPTQRDAVMRAFEDVSQSRLWVDDTPGRTAEDIRRRVRRHVARHGPLDMVAVDYAGLLKLSQRKDERHDQALGNAARTLREMGRELGCTVVLVWQLNRKAEGRGSPVPKLSDLKGSGDAEQHADMVLAPFRPGYYDSTRPDQTEAEIYRLKNRGGETGSDLCRWDGPSVRFHADNVVRLRGNA